MSYKNILINLYYILVNSDGRQNEKEVLLGKQMCKTEGISEIEFEEKLNSLTQQNKAQVQTESVTHLKKLNRNEQVKAIAWLCLVANSDGFMDREEWKFIYKLYYTELQLPLEEILSVQKMLTHAKTSLPGSMRNLLFQTIL
jgi:uncharacterized tellurite resistance protein B-like protein